jgi:hypothetical protein
VNILEVLNALNTLSPLAVIGLLAYVVYLLVNNRKETTTKLDEVTSNHLHELPEIADTLRRIESALLNVQRDTIYIKARINGRTGNDTQV